MPAYSSPIRVTYCWHLSTNDKFIELVKKHTEFAEFSPALINEFIEKVVVHEAEKINGKRTMNLDIYLNFIGYMNLKKIQTYNETIKKNEHFYEKRVGFYLSSKL